MRAISLGFLVFLHFLPDFGQCWKSNYITTTPFEKIFPYTNKSDVQKLVDEGNVYNDGAWGDGFKGKITDFVLQKMILPSNWTKTYKKGNYSDPSDDVFLAKVTAKQAFSLERAFIFLRHRDTVTRYIRYIFRSFQILGYFGWKDAAMLRKIFWDADKTCKNNFECTESEFFINSGEHFMDRFQWIKVDMNLVAYSARKFPTIEKYLYWKIDNDKY